MNADYIGSELELFQYAVNWKKYFSSFFRPYVRGRVAEVGAGMGANVLFLLNASVAEYLCVEPDAKLATAIGKKIAAGELPTLCSVKQGFLEETANAFDTVVYIDVLEHIEDDRGEIGKAAACLKPGGYLCVLVPANPGDYTDFDKAIGHFRRYTKKTLVSAVAPSLQIEWCHYLDFFGSVASKTNKLFLKQSYPTKKQVLFWDRFLVPVSKLLDKPTGYRHGKSLLLVARKRD
ncbi:class I SAM-dependent methyltransferase [Flavisolibacter ginsenosidimutans]|uniref:Class I SAM-dependent methyltransferase n=1 Tax=Flavisolibacter ginsenosidimutans TaxID=661481 RepID=A0A5B8ULP4_9BACT|nr:class I SAM-dependent methyltransferase [Flavisolibacter ginsenosidimutans]QEC57356.1 class I SAM-dependent methyltransferase [Flavisolibacter ginsenosidimutans]